MDFFSSQDRARKLSRTLIVYFALAVIGIIAAVYCAAVFLFGAVGAHVAEERGHAAPVEQQIQWWNPELLLFFGGGSAALILLASGWKTMQLRSGGGAVARSLGGRQVLADTKDGDERRLLNVVEEMAIASGVPVPEVYILEDEESINGFAAGLTQQNAAIAVTKGCLTQLNRDELQGVIAHEFSHILNGDMRLNVRLMGLLFGILALSILGQILMRSLWFAPRGGSRDNKNGGVVAIYIFGLVLMLIGYIGVFFGRLIQSAVSRQREFLADAAAVQFTRNPEGIGGALIKIGQQGSVIRNPQADDAAHLFFASGFSFSLGGALATHPPLKQRIKAILPNWEPGQPIAKRAASATTKSNRGERAVVSDDSIADQVVASVGQPTSQHLALAVATQAALSEPMREAVHNRQRVVPLCFALLLIDEETTRLQQLKEIAAYGGEEMASEVRRAYVFVKAEPRDQKLVLLQLGLPALRLGLTSTADFCAAVAKVARLASGEDLFAWLAAILMRMHLGSATGVSSEMTVENACARILVRLAEVEAESAQVVKQVLQQATQGLDLLRLETYDPQKYPKTFDGLEQALLCLQASAPLLRRQLIEAGTRIVLHNGSVSTQEGELLQLFALILQCPLPPFDS